MNRFNPATCACPICAGKIVGDRAKLCAFHREQFVSVLPSERTDWLMVALVVLVSVGSLIYALITR